MLVKVFASSITTVCGVVGVHSLYHKYNGKKEINCKLLKKYDIEFDEKLILKLKNKYFKYNWH